MTRCENPHVIEGGRFPFQTSQGNIIMLSDPGAGKIVSEHSRTNLLDRKASLTQSIEDFIQQGILNETDRKRAILHFLHKNPDMIEVFEIG